MFSPCWLRSLGLPTQPASAISQAYKEDLAMHLFVMIQELCLELLFLVLLSTLDVFNGVLLEVHVFHPDMNNPQTTKISTRTMGKRSGSTRLMSNVNEKLFSKVSEKFVMHFEACSHGLEMLGCVKSKLQTYNDKTFEPSKALTS